MNIFVVEMAEIPINIQDVDSTDSAIKKLIKNDVRMKTLCLLVLPWILQFSVHFRLYSISTHCNSWHTYLLALTCHD